MATNLIKQQVGTAITFLSTGGTAVISFGGIATGAGRQSGRADFGAWPKAGWWRWYGETQMQATPTVGKAVSLFLAPWDNDTGPADPWGDLTGTVDAAFATKNDLLNLLKVGDIVCDAATANVKFIKGGRIFIPTRYATLVMWNDMGATSHATSSNSLVRFMPMMPDVQAAA